MSKTSPSIHMQVLYTFIETPEEKASKRKKGKNLEEKRRERKKEKIP